MSDDQQQPPSDGGSGDGGGDDPRDPKKDKRTDYEKANAVGDVSPADERIFEFLDSLFIDAKNFPESIDVRQVTGREFTKMGEPVKKIPFGSSVKPSKERLVAIANDIVFRIKVDCDIRQRETMYHVAARNSQLSDEFYDRILYRCKPRKTWAKRGDEMNAGGGAGGDDEDETFANRYNGKMLDHFTQFFGLIGGMMEGLIDRSDRQANYAFDQLSKAQAKNIELLEANLRLVQASDERSERIEKAKMWRENVNRGLGMAWDLVPPMIGALTAGKNGHANWQPGTDSADALTLRSFFETKDRGGRLTADEFNSIFTTSDRPGILSAEQGQLLAHVSAKETNPDQLDQLLPGGPLEITRDQFQRIMSIGIPADTLMPLYALLQARLARQQQNKNGQGE